MALNSDVNYNALSWVQAELQATFASATDNLTRYTQESDANSIVQCIEQLHQTVGILDMLHLSGASLLASEMQALALALHAKQSKDPDAAQDLLMQSLILLPNYLKQLNKTQQDHPLHLIETINGLRTLRGETEIDAYSLFSPVLSVPLPSYVAPHPETFVSQNDLQQSNVHQTFQMLLLNWIQNTDSGNLIQISQIIHRLRLNSAEERSVQLWWAAEGVIESLLNNGLSSDNMAKLLLGELRAPLTVQIQKSEIHLLNVFPRELLTKLLFLVAKSTSEGEHTTSLKYTFALNFFDQEQHNQIYNLSSDALAQARETLYTEIQHTKEEVSQLEQITPHQSDQLHRIAQQIADMANTLHLLDEKTGKTLLQTEAGHVKTAAQANTDLDRFQLLSLANTLLKVEALVQPTIHDVADTSPELEHLQHSVIKECLIEMAGVKEVLSILDNNETDNPASLIITATHQIYNIAGNLSMVGFAETADLFTATATHLTDNAQTLSPERISLFAESIAAGELFMEGILQHGQPLELMIKQAQNNLGKIDSLPTGTAPISEITPDLSSTKPVIETSVSHYISALEVAALAATMVEPDLTRNMPATETSVSHYIAQLEETTQAVSPEADLGASLQNPSEPEEDAPLLVPEVSITPITNLDEPLIVPASALSIPDDLAQEKTLSVSTDKDQSATVEIDDDIAEVFAEEADEISREFHHLIPAWQEQQNAEALTDIRRYFHTLKGSGRMANAETVSELAWAVENLLNRVIDGVEPTSDAIEQIVADTHSVLPELIYRFNQRQLESTATVDDLHARILAIVDRDETDDLSLEDELRFIFNHEASQHIASLQYEANLLEKGQLPIRKELIRAAHSLKGCAAIADVMPVASLALKLDTTLRELFEQQRPLDDERSTLLRTILGDIEKIIKHVHESTPDNVPEINFIEDKISQLLSTEAEAITIETPDDDDNDVFDPEILAVFLEEYDELRADYSRYLTHWREQRSPESRDAVHQGLQELMGSTQSAGLDMMHTIYLQMDKLVLQVDSNEPLLFDLLDEGHQQLHQQIAALKHNHPLPEVEGFNTQVKRFLADLAIPEVAETTDDASTEYMAEESELLDTFIEEAGELLVSSAGAIKRWEHDPHDDAAQNQLQRDLHTLKGGSRLTDILPIGNLSHHMESLILMGVENNNTISADFFSLLHRCQDRLAEMQEQLIQRQAIVVANDLHTAIASFISPDPDPAPSPHIEQSNSNVIPLAPPIVSAPATLTPVQSPATTEAPQPALPGLAETAAATVEQIRVRSDLLDNLSNFAGEVSISRDRASQQNIAAQQQVIEMEETVTRLQSQLRQLEIETEAQILFRYEDTSTDAQSDFDPLELDRFSMIQQLSRSLTESVSDLNDIRHSMAILARETEDILQQQSRLTTDLQQGLMNTRLLPFSGLVARLDRIVRQTSNELNKPTELVIVGAEKELDRVVLNRILAPIEHLLRNAIAHGIESEEQRLNVGKPATGKIQLTIEHDGPEVVLTLSDDGQGINLEKVRQQAIEQQLISSDLSLSDEELTQLIFSAGLSTSDDVSQVSGRGIGMDVVTNEIRALKGRIGVQSVAGKGTTFSLHLPLRLSIIQALIVNVQTQEYAIPLNNVHTIIKPTAEQINSLLSQPNSHFEYANESYTFYGLNTLLNQKHDTADFAEDPPSLLLFKARNVQFALLVDGVQGNREIVVKPLSTQLNSIHAINGATILGNGQIIFILDLLGLIEHVSESTQAKLGDAIAPATPTVSHSDVRLAMVVDDSITMRKASSNLLKRQGFAVITARDGLEAVALLHEQKPDIILLDIEMPRMDGYEFATHVRNDDEFKDLPIIMITSRDSDKHRQRAMEIGVNNYLGKPYQEAQLVAEIEKLLGPISHSSNPNS